MIILALFVVLCVALLVPIYLSSLQHPQSESSSHNSPSIEIDAITVVSRVIDGDTFDTTSQGRIRLADIDTPESGQNGYYEAGNFLSDLVLAKTVYLDIDDVYRTDPYDRLVCVVYVDYNSTYLMNVNKALLVGGYAAITNFENEFNPDTWSLYSSSKSANITHTSQTNQNMQTSQKFVGSVNNNVYRYPNCSYAQQIKPENRIWFSSPKDARAHGYRPAS
jgi:micrococcal nuclease